MRPLQPAARTGTPRRAHLRRPLPATWTAAVITVAALALTSCGAAETTAAGDDEPTVQSATAEPKTPDPTASSSTQSASAPEARMYHEMVSPADGGDVLVFGGQPFHGWDVDVASRPLATSARLRTTRSPVAS